MITSAVLVLAAAWPLQEAAPPPIRVGIVAFEDFREEFERRREWLQKLAEKHTPLRFQLAVGPYGDVEHWLRKGMIDVAVVTPGLFAAKLADDPRDETANEVRFLAVVGKPAARGNWAKSDRRESKTHDWYRAVCVVSADSALKTIEDVRRSRNPSFVCVHPSSVSSRIAPAFAMKAAKIEMPEHRVIYTQSHSGSIRLLAEKNLTDGVRIAFVWDDALRGVPELAERVRVIPFPELDGLQIPSDVVIAGRGFERAELVRTLLDESRGDAGQQDFVRPDDWPERYAAVRKWSVLAGLQDAAELQQVSLDEIGRLLAHQARSQPKPPRLALVLSGGGAKCSYQVGAVAAIEEKLGELRRDNPGTDLDISLVVGTSGGAINSLPIALGVTRSDEGRKDFLDVWQKLDQRKIVRPAKIVRGNIGLWFALAQMGIVLWILRRYVTKPEKRGWVFGGIFAGLASFEIVLRYLELAPWGWLGDNHLLHHAWLWMSFGIGASAWSVLGIGVVVLLRQWYQTRRGQFVHISTRSATWLLAAALLGLPLIQVVTVLFFQTTLSDGQGIEESLAAHFPALIDGHLHRDGQKSLAADDGKSDALRLKATSRQVIERKLLARDLVITGSCLEQSSRTLPTDLYFFAASRGRNDLPPFGPRGISLTEHPGLLLDVVMGSGSIFPVFPSRRLDDFPQPGDYVELVDGGFAHNSPIEAAVLWGATHVLLIEASPRERAQRNNFLQNAAASFDHLYEQSQLLDSRSRGKVSVFTLAPEPPHLCVLDFADNLIRNSAEKGYRDASGRVGGGDAAVAGRPRFRKEPGEPLFVEIGPR